MNVDLIDVGVRYSCASRTYLSPAAWSSAILVLDEQVSSANLALWHTGDSSKARSGAVVLGHVVLELFRVCSLGRLPAGNLLGRVEVVWEVLGVGVAHLPVGGKTGISLQSGERA